jgi:hypothetical protein
MCCSQTFHLSASHTDSSAYRLNTSAGLQARAEVAQARAAAVRHADAVATLQRNADDMRRAHREQLQLAEEMLEAKVRVRVCVSASLRVCICCIYARLLCRFLNRWCAISPAYSMVVVVVESTRMRCVGHDMNLFNFVTFDTGFCVVSGVAHPGRTVAGHLGLFAAAVCIINAITVLARRRRRRPPIPAALAAKIRPPPRPPSTAAAAAASSSTAASTASAADSAAAQSAAATAVAAAPDAAAASRRGGRGQGGARRPRAGRQGRGAARAADAGAESSRVQPKHQIIEPLI